MSDVTKMTDADAAARFEVEQYLFDCARPIVGHAFTDYEKHALFHRFKRHIEQLSALRAKLAEVERERDGADVIAVQWAAVYADDPGVYLFDTEPQARGMLGQNPGEVFKVNVVRVTPQTAEKEEGR